MGVDSTITGNFIKRWNPNGWILRPVRRPSSARICSSKTGNFASVCQGRTANRGMLRLGSSATAIFDS
jgi:hypothetical protein